MTDNTCMSQCELPGTLCRALVGSNRPPAPPRKGAHPTLRPRVASARPTHPGIRGEGDREATHARGKQGAGREGEGGGVRSVAYCSRVGNLPRPRACRAARTRGRARRPDGGVIGTTCLWQRERPYRCAADLRNHVRHNDHGVCSTIGEVLHGVPHHDRGWVAVSKRRRVLYRHGDRVLAKEVHPRRTFAVVPRKEWQPPPFARPRCGAFLGVLGRCHKVDEKLPGKIS